MYKATTLYRFLDELYHIHCVEVSFGRNVPVRRVTSIHPRFFVSFRSYKSEYIIQWPFVASNSRTCVPRDSQ